MNWPINIKSQRLTQIVVCPALLSHKYVLSARLLVNKNINQDMLTEDLLGHAVLNKYLVSVTRTKPGGNYKISQIVKMIDGTYCHPVH